MVFRNFEIFHPTKIAGGFVLFRASRQHLAHALPHGWVQASQLLPAGLAVAVVAANHAAIDEMLGAFGIEKSLAREGHPCDNAVEDPTNKMLKVEFACRGRFSTLAELRSKPGVKIVTQATVREGPGLLPTGLDDDRLADDQSSVHVHSNVSAVLE